MPSPSQPNINVIKFGEKIKAIIELTNNRRRCVNRVKLISLFIYVLVKMKTLNEMKVTVEAMKVPIGSIIIGNLINLEFTVISSHSMMNVDSRCRINKVKVIRVIVLRIRSVTKV